MSEKIVPNSQQAEVLRVTRETLIDLKKMVEDEIVRQGFMDQVGAADFLVGKTFDQVDVISSALEKGEDPVLALDKHQNQ
jgi:hypothetical protein